MRRMEDEDRKRIGERMAGEKTGGKWGEKKQGRMRGEKTGGQWEEAKANTKIANF